MRPLRGIVLAPDGLAYGVTFVGAPTGNGALYIVANGGAYRTE